MATSKIGTGLIAVQIPTNKFTWDNTNKIFACSKSDYQEATSGLSRLVFLVVFGNPDIICWGVSRKAESTTAYIRVCGWNAGSNVSITSNNNNFVVYAIGY